MTGLWLAANPSHDTINTGCASTWQGRERRWLWLEGFSSEGDAPSITSPPGEAPASPGKRAGTQVVGSARFPTPRDGLKGSGRAGGFFL